MMPGKQIDRRIYVGKAYPREGCALTIKVGADGHPFALIETAPCGSFIASTRAPKESAQVAQAVARWLAGEAPVPPGGLVQSGVARQPALIASNKVA